ncbi:MlaA family lipoprotein [Bowmanella dokdonensis]|uniref:VacJ family lipoprotein n=1 Tax=Bowmanella dokdonensis TaxID=751969 RepID=A0A939ISE2_9ALTE|nr:VacJ family lipoprotein [Bowmanella dokdonensis]MBN7826336.1 VacJ family lipoprotein [Bowmanella dokdonensis]
MRSILLLLLPVIMLGGCASNQGAEQAATASSQPVQAQTQDSQAPRDPLEGINRKMWTLNWDYLDTYIARPAAVFYRDYLPDFARTGLYNAATNLEEPANGLNNLLQGKVGDSLVSVGRFVLNSTVGLLGTIDVASEIGLMRKEEGFDEVLGVWGVGNGPFLMLPGMGPTDVRGGVGDYVDSAYWPVDALSWQLSLFRWSIDALESRVQLMQQEQMINGAVDPYALVKDIYFQNKEYEVKDGQVEPDPKEQELDEDIEAYLDGL